MILNPSLLNPVPVPTGLQNTAIAPEWMTGYQEQLPTAPAWLGAGSGGYTPAPEWMNAGPGGYNPPAMPPYTEGVDMAPEWMGQRPITTFIGPKAENWSYSDQGKFGWSADTLSTKKEISDANASFDSNAWSGLLNDGDSIALGQYLFHHPELFANYPWLENVPVLMDAYRQAYTAAASPNVNNPYIILAKEHGKDQVLHEIQHLIQNKEGWAVGGSSKRADYSNLAGEIEARATANRMNLTPMQREATQPYVGQEGIQARYGRVSDGTNITLRGYQEPLENIVARYRYPIGDTLVIRPRVRK